MHRDDKDELAVMAIRLAQLEAQQKRDEDEMKPIIDLYKASRLLGRSLFVVGGIVVGAVTFWKLISDWVLAHIK